tara:strand:+ start:222 stop:872 length:651 start_codon:yes stop_codon:yes gene_type:complete
MSCVTLNNLDKCKNTLLYLLSLQIPGNREKILKCKPKIIYCESSAGTIVKQIVNPNIILFEKELVKIDLIDGADAFVIGYIAKTIDIGIMNNFKKFITKNIQIPLMFRSLIKDFYVVDAQEILCNIAQNNYYFINQIDPDENTLKFGLGSFAALSDYLNFEHNYYPTFETLYLYLTYNKKIIMKNVEIEVNKKIDKNEIYKNDLYISTLLEINNHH